MSDRPEFTLLGTDDAMVWAEEFCRIFKGHVVIPNDADHKLLTEFESSQFTSILDEGTMVGWFANAMQTAINLYERRALTAKEEQQESFLEGFQEGRPDT